MREMCWIGCDPGVSGAVACVFESGRIAWQGNDVTYHDMAAWIRDLVANHYCFAIVENVHSMPKQGVASSFNFGKSFGVLIGLLTALDVPHEFVTPQAWQAVLKCRSGGDKNVTKAAAQRLWPSMKITHRCADALLLAEFCRRVRSVTNERR